LWGAVVVGVIAALICGTIAYGSYAWGDYLADYGVTTTGTVTDRDFTDTLTVEFTTDDGEAAVAEVVWFSSPIPRVGDEVEITYDPWDPTSASEADGGVSDFIVAAIFGFLGVLALAVVAGALVGAILVHRARGKARLRGPTW
jgi:hypothetical protein